MRGSLMALLLPLVLGATSSGRSHAQPPTPTQNITAAQAQKKFTALLKDAAAQIAKPSTPLEQKAQKLLDVKNQSAELLDRLNRRIQGDEQTRFYLGLARYNESLKRIPLDDFDAKNCSDARRGILLDFDPQERQVENTPEEVQWVLKRLEDLCKIHP